MGAKLRLYRPMIDAGDTYWILISSALVMLMTPAVGFFYGGMVRQKNVLAMMGQSLIILSLVSLQWMLFGYSLAFGKDLFGLIGNFDWTFLKGVGLDPNPDYAADIPHLAFAVFQCMFAAITPALIIGAFADRIKFESFLLFSFLWSCLVYDPVAHWIWARGGWLREIGSLDFAGGTVVHITAGASALAAALIIGRRLGYGSEKMLPHAIPFTILGGALLWFGWFGFNAGSALGDERLAVHAFLTTNLAAAAGALAWILTSRLQNQKPSVSGIMIGTVSGLVGITPACGYVSPLSAVMIGLIAGALCHAAMNLRGKSEIDDSLDVLACHGVGGIWGALATGLFAEEAINPAGANGLFFGNPGLLLTQLIAVLVVLLYSFVLTALLLYALKATVGLRVTPREEKQGLDLAVHGEEAYFMLPIGDEADTQSLHVLEGVKVGEVMNTKVRTVSPGDNLESVQDLMLEKQHFALPVLDDSRKVLGVITIKELRKVDHADRKHRSVNDIYLRQHEVAFPEETIHDLIERMQEKHISNLPVIRSDGDRELIGIISKSDLITAYKRIVVSNLTAEVRN
ncbi:MAG: ammonium transporter [Candidatus Caenarcaniphilales bacterium]|nr:ammonium transporter [Candidatus Caenarcaniphilales bacterium]